MAALVGFFQDCLSGGVLGVNFYPKGSSDYFFVSLKIRLSCKVLFRLVFYVCYFFGGRYDLFCIHDYLAGRSDQRKFLFSSIILFGVYNAVIAPFLFYMFDKARQWLHRKLPTQSLKSI